MTHTPVTKEALVEEIQKFWFFAGVCHHADCNFIRYDEGICDCNTKENKRTLDASLDRYATAQRAEGAREAREKVCSDIKSKIQMYGMDPTGLCASLIEQTRTTPTETDNHETV